MINNYFIKRHAGFTLVELAIVLAIFGIVLSALLLPLQAQRTQIFQSQTEATLENAKRALLGYAQAQGRLPCPATAASNGMEQPLGGTNAATPLCTQQVGFLPAATLSVEPADAQGFAIDGWNNRIRYAVTQSNSGGATTPDYTTTGDMANVGISVLAPSPNLRVCGTSTAASCTAAINLTNNAVAVIYSLGATGSQAIGGVDETENLNAVTNIDTIYVSHDITAVGALNGEFDHLVTWISPYVLYNAMIQAGQLH
jgi:prepilin-type N-terminal cleavage/methylation domain-containing protein